MKQLILVLSLISALFAQAQLPERFYQNGKVGYKDATGKVIATAQFDAGSDFQDGFALVMKGQNAASSINKELW